MFIVKIISINSMDHATRDSIMTSSTIRQYI